MRHQLRRRSELAGHVSQVSFQPQGDERANYLIVEATPNNLAGGGAQARHQNRQVLIEARMVQNSTSFVRSLVVR